MLCIAGNDAMHIELLVQQWLPYNIELFDDTLDIGIDIIFIVTITELKQEIKETSRVPDCDFITHKACIEGRIKVMVPIMIGIDDTSPLCNQLLISCTSLLHDRVFADHFCLLIVSLNCIIDFFFLLRSNVTITYHLPKFLCDLFLNDVTFNASRDLFAVLP